MADVIDAIIAEALGEGPEGMAAVAHVIATRARQTGKTPQQVVSEAGQFEGVSKPGRAATKAMKDPMVRAQVENIWKGVRSGEIPNPFPGADHFHTPAVKPSWSRSFDRLGQRGNHIFYASGKTAPAPRPAVKPASIVQTRGPRMATPFTNKDGDEFTREVVWSGYDEGLKPEVVEVLNRAQQLVDFPIVLNSGYRSPERNRRANGAKKSMHMQGLAADVSLRGLSNEQRTQLTRAFAQSGARRLIAYTGNTKMHLDMATGYKPQKGYPVYAMFDATSNKMDRAPAWYKAGLDGGKIPPRNMPDGAPRPQIISAGLGGARNNPPPLPRRPTLTPPRSASLDPNVMAFNGIDAARPSNAGNRQRGRPFASGPPMPPRMASLEPPSPIPMPPTARAKRELVSLLNEPLDVSPFDPFAPLPNGRQNPRPERLPGRPFNPTITMEFERGGAQPRQRVASVPQGVAAPVPQRIATSPAIPRIVATEPTLPPFPMPHTGALKARAGNPMAAIPETEAERMFQGSQFALPPLPRARPPFPPMPMPVGMRPQAPMPQAPVPMPISMRPPPPAPPFPMAANMRPQMPPMPMPAFMRPMGQAPLAITVGGGNRMAPQPMPRLVRAAPLLTPVQAQRARGLSPGDAYAAANRQAEQRAIANSRDPRRASSRASLAATFGFD